MRAHYEGIATASGIRVLKTIFALARGIICFPNFLFFQTNEAQSGSSGRDMPSNAV
jgi:hypothetical protein